MEKPLWYDAFVDELTKEVVAQSKKDISERIKLISKESDEKGVDYFQVIATLEAELAASVQHYQNVKELKAKLDILAKAKQKPAQNNSAVDLSLN